MKILFWNIRGLGAEGRRRQLSELRLSHRMEIICLQETIKSEFSLGDLSALSEGFNYEWIWTAAQGHSGGTLVGVRTDNYIVMSKDSGEFFSSTVGDSPGSPLTTGETPLKTCKKTKAKHATKFLGKFC
jgi:exonuclease III